MSLDKSFERVTGEGGLTRTAVTKGNRRFAWQGTPEKRAYLPVSIAGNKKLDEYHTNELLQKITTVDNDSLSFT